MAQCARTRVRWAWLAVAAVAWLVVDAPLPVAAQWCGGKDCYGVLGVQPDATARQIRSAYRSLSLKHHPDKNPDDQAGAAQRFQAIAAAYEVLSDEGARKDYDWARAHPEAAWVNRYSYYRYAAKKTDWRTVVATLVAVLSAGVYLIQHHKYKTAQNYIRNTPENVQKAKRLAIERAKERGIDLGSATSGGGGKKGKGAAKAAAAERMATLEAEVMDEIVANTSIQGGYRKPTWRDIVAVQLALLPWSIAKYFWWLGRWTLLFTILKRPLGPDEKAYLSYKALRRSQQWWEAQSEEVRAEIVEARVWEPERLAEWRTERMRSSMSEAQFRRYKRYAKRR